MRDSALFMLSTFLPAQVDDFTDEDRVFHVDCKDVPADVYVALLNAFDNETGRFLPYAFGRAASLPYLKARATHHPSLPLPETLAEFESMTGFRNWPRDIVRLSRVKDRTRSLFHSPSDAPVKMSVALTHESRDGDIETHVRETEILLKRETEGSPHWDFFVYDHDGKLSTQSVFRGPPQPAPNTCMACHYSALDRAFLPIRRAD